MGWTYAAARDAGLEDVLLSTEDDDFSVLGEELGFRQPLRRPAALSLDTARNIDVVMHLINWFETETGCVPYAILLLQPTSPFRGANLIRQALTAFAEQPLLPGVIAVTSGQSQSGAGWRIGEDRILRRDIGEGAGEPCRSTGALYLIRSEVIRAVGTTSPEGCLGLMHHGASTVDIDTLEDLDRARQMVADGHVKPPSLISYSQTTAGTL